MVILMSILLRKLILIPMQIVMQSLVSELNTNINNAIHHYHVITIIFSIKINDVRLSKYS